MSFSAEWHALGREAELAAEQIAAGITALGQANHAQRGLYTQAFFGLSVGIERIAKLVIIADSAVKNSGQFPTDRNLRKIGHDIADLLNYCEPISSEFRSGKEYADRPDTPIHQGIVQTLTEFGKQSRYYNLDVLVGGKGGKAAQLPEPIAAWWHRVALPILDKHYSVRQRLHDLNLATEMVGQIGGSSFVIHHSESGHLIDNIEELMLLDRATRIVQAYGRLYTLQIVRWLAFLVSDLSHLGAYKKRIEPLLGLDEPFLMFRSPDKYFRDRRRWSIYL